MESSESQPSAHNHDRPIVCHSPDEGNEPDSSPSIVPPYWSHRRYESYTSVKNTKPPPITLEDHTEEPSEQSGAVWAKGVTVDDHVLVSGTVPSVGSFVVWNCRVETLDVSPIVLLIWNFVSARMVSNGSCSKGGSMIIRKRSMPARPSDELDDAENATDIPNLMTCDGSS